MLAHLHRNLALGFVEVRGSESRGLGELGRAGEQLGRQRGRRARMSFCSKSGRVHMGTMGWGSLRPEEARAGSWESWER